jgi:hypothetical protein
VTTVLTVSALDLGIDKAVNYMGRVCRRFATTGGRHQVQVRYPAMLDPSGDNPGGSIQTGARNLDRLIRSTTGPKIVLGYSQGAQVCGAWMRRYAYLFDAPDHRELSFILIGNPERRYGQQPWTAKQTPDDTRYAVRDVARRSDNWADWHGQPTDNRFLAMFGKIHTNYWDTDIYDPAAEVGKVAGNTTYVVVP